MTSHSISISQLAYILLNHAKLDRRTSARWAEIIRTEWFYARCTAVTWFNVMMSNAKILES